LGSAEEGCIGEMNSIPTLTAKFVFCIGRPGFGCRIGDEESIEPFASWSRSGPVWVFSFGSSTGAENQGKWVHHDRASNALDGLCRPGQRTASLSIESEQVAGRNRSHMTYKRRVHCPECSSPDLRRSQIRILDLIRLALFMTPVRCRKCRKRFFSWRWEKLVSGDE